MKAKPRVVKASANAGRDRVEIAIVTILFIATAIPALQVKVTFQSIGMARESVWLLIYGFAAFRIIGLWSQARSLAPQAAVIASYGVLALASTAWSVDPSRTLFSSIELLGSGLFGFYLVLRFPLATMLRMLAVKLLAFAVISYFLIFLSPARGRDDWGGGPWSGIFSDKNALGAEAVLTFLVMLAIWPASARNRILFLIASALLVVLLVFSRSATALSAGLATFVVILVLMVWRSKRSTSITRFVVIASVVVGAAAIRVFGITSDSVLSLLGRNSSLTSRADFWPYLAQAVGDRPVLGYGYLAFFHSDAGNQYLATFVLEQAGGWYPFYAHNSFYQAALDLGFVGVALALVVVVVGTFRAFRYSLTVLEPSSTWPIAIYLYTIMSSYTESSFAMANTDLWIMQVAAMLYPVDGRSVIQRLFVPSSPRVRARPRAPSPGA